MQALKSVSRWSIKCIRVAYLFCMNQNCQFSKSAIDVERLIYIENTKIQLVT